MNLLPPISPVKKYFGLWLLLILMGLLVGATGVVYTKIQLDPKLALIEKNVNKDRVVWQQIQSNKKKAQEFERQFGTKLNQQKIAQSLADYRIPWKDLIQQIESSLPSEAKLFQLKGTGNRLDGWGTFSSVKEANDFVLQMAKQDPQIENGWIDCIGTTCSDMSIPEESIHLTTVHFHFTYRTNS